jgi:hypothetical protein
VGVETYGRNGDSAHNSNRDQVTFYPTLSTYSLLTPPSLLEDAEACVRRSQELFDKITDMAAILEGVHLRNSNLSPAYL